MKEIKNRCWIEKDGQKLFGPGPYQLLKHIETKGSISLAAKEMKMSYKKAWDIVDRLNTLSQSPLVISHKGGKSGGGAELTVLGQEIVKKYENLLEKISEVVKGESGFIELF